MGRKNSVVGEGDAVEDAPGFVAPAALPTAPAAAGMVMMMPGMQPSIGMASMMQGGMGPMMPPGMGMMMMPGMQPGIGMMMVPGMQVPPSCVPQGIGMMMMPGMQAAMSLANPVNEATADRSSLIPNQQASVDPRVKQLCRHFGIDDKTCHKLNAAMQKREEFDEDMQALWEVIERAQNANRKPMDVLLVKIREIERGTFAGKDLLDKDIQAFAEKFELDDRVLNRLIETINMRKDKKQQDLKNLTTRLESAKRPAGLLVRLLEGLQEHGRMPSPPRFLGLSQPSSSHRDRADNDDFERERKDRDGRRQRSRSRSRDRRR